MVFPTAQDAADYFSVKRTSIYSYIQNLGASERDGSGDSMESLRFPSIGSRRLKSFAPVGLGDVEGLFSCWS